MAKVYISATLRNFFDKNASVEVDALNVKQALAQLAEKFPDSSEILYDAEGKLRSFIQIFVGEENRTHTLLWEKELAAGHEILLLPTIAGGAPIESVISDERRKAVSFDDKEVEQFGKHLMLREIGVKGQKRIKAAKVVVIGAGALGSAVIQNLAVAGVGTIKIVDPNDVTLESLQNQVLHTLRDVNRPRVASAKDKIKSFNRNIVVDAVKEEVTAENIQSLIEGYDIVVDCSDNYKSRYLVSDACALNKVPEVFGAIYQYEGQVAVFNLNDGPCYRCLFREPPPSGLVPTCASSGTISTLPNIIGSIQANEVLKLIAGIGETLAGKLLIIDSLYLTSRVVNVKRHEECPVCSEHPTITQVEAVDYDELCGLKVLSEEEIVEGVEPEVLAKRIHDGEPLTVIDVREPHERAILRFPGAIAIPIGQLARRQNELDPTKDTIFICKQGKRSILAVNTLREAGYTGPMYNLKGGVDAMKDIMFIHEGAWL